MELFVTISGFEYYAISNYGRVYSFKTARYLSHNIHYKNKYHSVNLKYKDKSKRLSIHRLVAEYFVHDKKGDHVNHKDGNKSNNHYSNLEWCTNHENRLHAVENGLHNMNPVIAVKDSSLIEFKSAADCARYINGSTGWIIKCKDKEKVYKGYKYYSV